MAVPPGNRRDSDLRRTCSVRRKVSLSCLSRACRGESVEGRPEDALKGTEFARAQVGTLRLKLFKIGARIRETSRRVWIQMASGYPYQRLFASLVATLKAAPT
jgi:hypothetical protein